MRLPSESRIKRHFFALALALSCLPAKAEEPVRPELPPDQEAAAIRNAEVTGAVIFRHDRAAAVATDAALKNRTFKKDKRLAGWITQEQGSDIVMTFIDQSPAALYRVVVSSTGNVIGEVDSYESPIPLSAYESGAAAARAAAMASEFEPCAEKYNTVVLPANSSRQSDWVVYLLPATTKNDLVPVGGTYRVETDGKEVGPRRGFTLTCITLQNDDRAVALMITHLLDPVPTEAHVFWSLWAGKSMYVMTPPDGTVWKVEGGKIGLVERNAAKD
jgi:hypothetical protein